MRWELQNLEDHSIQPMRLSPIVLLIALFVSLFAPHSSRAQYDLEVEVVSENIGVLAGALGVTDLTGYSCTRVYITMENEDDFLSSISGDANNPTYVNTTTTFYHAVLGGATPNGINSLLFAVYPDLAYDSWVTIGLEGTPNAVAGEAAVSTVQSSDNPWSTTFDPGGGLPGGNVAIDDGVGGAWYALNGDANGIAGPDLKVLAGQFTTDGDLSLQMYTQIFINGDGAAEVLVNGDRPTFTWPVVDVAGCTDDTACNYNPDATVDDESCTYADAGLDCDGNCLADADGDGICDDDEIPGCQDNTACNYNAGATDDDGSCTFAEAGLDCDGNCLADADGDGICDDDEIPGCQDNTACNYNAGATDDDGSCTFAEAGLDCDGNCLADADGDGICDGDEIAGCQDDTACNYNADATDDDGSCTYAVAGYDCDGNCLADADGDGICDDDEIPGCTDEGADNYNPDATNDDGSCAYTCAPEWGQPNPYPSVATVLALVTVDGENADMMDAVGAFVGSELRGAGDIIEFEGATYINMTVYLIDEEEMVDFLFFNQDECTTCTMDVDLTAMSFGEYGSFNDPLMFDANCSATELDVDVLEGWNYVSTNLVPESYAVQDLFEVALDGSLLKVLGDDDFALGGSYTPGIPSVFNSLQMHHDAAGYVIKVDESGIWTTAGEPLDPATTPLNLNEGWNIIGYVPSVSMSVEEALASIDGVVGTLIDGQNGTVWNPANPNEFNSLVDMEPGRSYWVRMIEAATLTYPSMDDINASGMAVAGVRTQDAAQTMTGWNVTVSPFAAALAAEVRLDEAPVAGEAYIGAFDGETCVAARPVVEVDGWSGAQMAIMLEDVADITFRLWVDGIQYNSAELISMSAGDEWGQGGDVLPVLRFTSVANAVATTDWVNTHSLSPMPANATTWLNLDLDVAGQARIVVLDARGAEVAVLHNGSLAAGQHRLAVDVTNWAAGTYFIQGISARGTFRRPLLVH